MQLGISSWAYPWAIGVPGWPPTAPLSACDLIARAHELGVSLVQIADNLPLDRLAPQGVRDLRELAADYGVRVQVGTRGIGAEHLARYVEIAAELSSPILRVVIDTAGCRPDEGSTVEALGRVLPSCAAAGVTLAIENHDRLRSRELVRILQRLDSPWVGICLDTANSLGALEGPDVTFQELVPWTVNLHIKDIEIVRAEHGLGYVIRGTPAGQGRIDIPWLLDLIRAHGRDPDAVIELWPPFQSTLGETIEMEQRWVAESVTYLRTLLPQ